MCVKSFTNKHFVHRCLYGRSIPLHMGLYFDNCTATNRLSSCFPVDPRGVSINLQFNYYNILDTIFIKRLNAMTFFRLERIRRLILPEVPDPKHFINKIMDTEQSQVRPMPSIISNALIWQNTPKDVCSSYSWRRFYIFTLQGFFSGFCFTK